MMVPISMAAAVAAALVAAQPAARMTAPARAQAPVSIAVAHQGAGVAASVARGPGARADPVVVDRPEGRRDPRQRFHEGPRFRRYGRLSGGGLGGYGWPAWWTADYDDAASWSDAGQGYGPVPGPAPLAGPASAPICPVLLHWSDQSHTATRQRLC